MNRDALDVARESYRGITLYATDRTPCTVDLSDNTNLWGLPPAAEQAIREVVTQRVTRYPELYASRLKEALAGYLGVPTEMIVTGCGSDDVLDSAIRAFTVPGDCIAFADPTFAMVPIFARMNGLESSVIPLSAAYDLDPARVLETRRRLIYLCSPNNPTGTTLPRSTIERIVASAEGVVIVDEAYAEFAGANVLDLVRANERVLVVRTMSKAFGLAGLRVGYAVGSSQLVAEVEKSRGPYKVNAIAERAAVAALTEGLPWVLEHVAVAKRARAELQAALRRLGIEPLPSEANFVLAPVRNALAIARYMRERGVAVRPFHALPAISPVLERSGGDALRISVGLPEMMDTMVTLLREGLERCG